jgi:hypothetical protein
MKKNGTILIMAGMWALYPAVINIGSQKTMNSRRNDILKASLNESRCKAGNSYCKSGVSCSAIGKVRGCLTDDTKFICFSIQ